ncbi:unnamed protein product, partial [Rotaria sordida]
SISSIPPEPILLATNTRKILLKYIARFCPK